MDKCRETSRQKKFVFQERKSKLTLDNTDEVESTKIKVDGCAITKGPRCDYLHQAKGIEMYIELKGQNIRQAVRQLYATIDELGATAPRGIKCYVICTSSPHATTEIQQFKRDFKKKKNADLVVKSSPHTDKY